MKKHFIIHITYLILYFKLVHYNDRLKVKVKVISRSNSLKILIFYPSFIFFVHKCTLLFG